MHVCTSVFVSVCCTRVTGRWGLCGQPGEECGWPGWDLVLAAPKGQAGKGTGGKGRSAAWGSAARRAREKGREGQGEEVTGPAGRERRPGGLEVAVESREG